MAVNLAKGGAEVYQNGWNTETKNKLKVYTRDFFHSLIDVEKVSVSIALSSTIGDTLSNLLLSSSVYESVKSIVNTESFKIQNETENNKTHKLIEVVKENPFVIEPKDWQGFIDNTDYVGVEYYKIKIDVSDKDSKYCHIYSTLGNRQKDNLILSVEQGSYVTFTVGEKSVNVMAKFRYERNRKVEVIVKERL